MRERTKNEKCMGGRKENGKWRKKKENWVNQSSFKNKNKQLGGSKIDTTPFNSKPRPAHRLHHHTCDLSSPMRHLLPSRPSAWQSARSTNSCRKTSLLHISFNPIYLGLNEDLWVWIKMATTIFFPQPPGPSHQDDVQRRQNRNQRRGWSVSPSTAAIAIDDTPPLYPPTTTIHTSHRFETPALSNFLEPYRVVWFVLVDQSCGVRTGVDIDRVRRIPALSTFGDVVGTALYVTTWS